MSMVGPFTCSVPTPASRPEAASPSAGHGPAPTILQGQCLIAGHRLHVLELTLPASVLQVMSPSPMASGDESPTLSKGMSMKMTLTDLGLATRVTQTNNTHTGVDVIGGFKI